MKEDTSFRRSENKFIVLENTFDEILKELEKHIPIHSFRTEYPLTLIETTYLEDSDFTTLKEYLSRRKFRFKIRFRCYGHNGKLDENDFWVELKIKQRSISYKKRFKLTKDLFIPFISGENIYEKVSKINEGVKGFKKIYKLTKELIKLNNLKPALVTSYERVAFQSKNKSIRITVDRNIVHKSYQNPSIYKKLKAIVLESKISGKIPKWYKAEESKLALLPQKRFSKYTTGINSIYFPGINGRIISNDKR
jgi:SPX domain protein involved in polyphosphate accumulation